MRLNLTGRHVQSPRKSCSQLRMDENTQNVASKWRLTMYHQCSTLVRMLREHETNTGLNNGPTD